METVDNGWVKLYRSVLKNPIVCKDTEHFAIWSYLLLNATHQETKAYFKGKKIMLMPGQLIVGRQAISEHFGGKSSLSESKVQRVLKTLEIEQQIEQQTSNKNRLITVVNWGLYQNIEQQNEQPVNNERTTTEQPVNTNKNVKNVKNERIKEKYLTTFGIFSNGNDELLTTLNDFEVMRNKIKKPLTERAKKMLITQLKEFEAKGHNVIEVLEQSIYYAWQGVFEVKEEFRKIKQKEKPVEEQRTGTYF